MLMPSLMNIKDITFAHFLNVVLSTFAVIDILRMIILHPDGARLLLKHVENQNGISHRNLPFPVLRFYSENGFRL